MFGLETLAGQTRAAATVGLVLAEAAALYVGYGALTSLASSAVKNAIGGS